MRSMPAATDLRGRSSVVLFSHKSSTSRPFRPLLACAVFAAMLAGSFTLNVAQGASGPITVGTIPGSVGVTPSGAATYSMPISLPRGSGGLTPQLALVFNSQSGTGMAGMQWTLSGFSTISRCNSAIYDDGQAQVVQLTASDDYCFNGQRLRLTGGTYGLDASTYDTEIESFSIITAHVDSGATNGPSWFTVQTKDGTVYEFGNTADSKILAQGTTVARVWALDKITDVNTNYITYSYQQDTTDGDFWPIAINYTGNTKAGTPLTHQVELDWAARAPADTQASYEAGSLVTDTELLQDIKVNYNGSTTLTYSLVYGSDGSTGRSLLTSVQECNSIDGNCFAATTITWHQSTPGWVGDTPTAYSVANQTLAESAQLIDVNGDGVADLVYPNTVNGTTDWWVAFGIPGNGGFSTPQDTLLPAVNYSTAQGIDYNGDGLADLLYENADGNWHVLQSTGSTGGGSIFTDQNTNISFAAAAGGFTVADLNGHGLGDIVYSDGSGLYAYQNTGGAFSSSVVTLAAPSSSTIREAGAGSYSKFSQFSDTPTDFVGSGRAGYTALVGNTTSTTCNGDSDPGCQPTENTSWSFFGYYPAGTSNNLAFNNIAGIAIGDLPGAIPPSGWTNPAPLSMRGDGLTDLLTTQNIDSNGNNYSIYNIYFSTGGSLKNAYEVLGAANSDPVFADYYDNGRQAMLVNPYQQATCNATASDPWCVITLNYSSTQHAFVSQATAIPAPYPSTYVPGTLKVGDIVERPQFLIQF